MINVRRNISAIVLSLLLHFYLYHSEHIKKIDYKFYDFTTLIFNKIQKAEDASYTVIVDIDEKSLQALGQWPWPRILDAKLINKIQELNPSGIGVNILFPEKDRVSPVSIQEFYKNFFDLKLQFNKIPQELQDNDKLLAQSIKKSKAVLPIYLNNNPYTPLHCQKLSYQHNLLATINTKLDVTSILCNHESIQKSVENFGFINTWTDNDGILRRVPFFMQYQEQIFPSFALAMVLNVDKDRKVDTSSPTLLVNFTQKNPKVFSAIDILEDEISAKKLQGKLVIIGSSVVGLNPMYTISNGSKISLSKINAFIIENILDNTLITQVESYKKINIIASFLLSILIIILLSNKFYIHIVLLFIVSVTITTVGLALFYLNNIYISIGYFWMPLLYFFTLILLYHTNLINKEKQEQEKFLIRQSKLASIGEMISLIAHQWRQPLSAINGIVLNIDVDYRKKILDHEKLDHYLNDIEETTTYLSKTINDFTDFFSKHKIREHFYIADILKQSKQLIAVSSQKEIDIVYKKKENVKVLGYRSELLQSLLIVLNNAIYVCKKNLPNTGKGYISIDTYALKENLIISIEDNGGGIDAENFKKIFDPYFTTKGESHGTGLGLYILKLIVEDSMNGKVSVSNGKEGAIFMIKIPLNPSQKPNKWGFLKRIKCSLT